MPPESAALVTGGARRIGAHLVRTLAGRGYAVAIHYRSSAAEAETLAVEIERAGGRAAAIQSDLADPAQLEELVAAAQAAVGPIRVLVNNAAIFEHDRAADFSLAQWDRQLAINLRAPVVLAREFARLAPRRCQRARGQSPRPADRRADQGLLQLHREQARAGRRDGAARHGARAAGARQRHRARPHPEQRRPDRGGFRAPDPPHPARQGQLARGDRPSAGLLPGGRRGHRPDSVRGRRPAAGGARPRRSGDGREQPVRPE